MPITLGKDVTVSAGGTIASARTATLTTAARTISIEEYGSRFDSVYSTGRSASVSLEFLNSDDSSALFTAIASGTVITVSGGAGSWSFPAVVTSVSENATVDGVVAFQVECQMTKEGLR